MYTSTADTLVTASICNRILEDVETVSRSIDSTLRIQLRTHQRERLNNVQVLLGAIRRCVLEIKSNH